MAFSQLDGTEPSISTEAVNGQHFRVTCTNFDTPLGIGNTLPLWVANSRGRKLYLNLVTYVLGANVGGGAVSGGPSLRVIHYQLSLGEPA